MPVFAGGKVLLLCVPADSGSIPLTQGWTAARQSCGKTGLQQGRAVARLDCSKAVAIARQIL